MKTLLSLIFVLSLTLGMASAQLAKPKLEGVPIEAAQFGEGWRIVLQIANRTFAYANDEKKVTVTVQILKEHPDAEAAKAGFAADLKRFGQKGETRENGEADTEVTSEFTTERYKQIGKFFVKFIQKKGESESINMFVDKYGTVLGAI